MLAPRRLLANDRARLCGRISPDDTAISRVMCGQKRAVAPGDSRRYPPVAVRPEDRQAYITALQNSQAGSGGDAFDGLTAGLAFGFRELILFFHLFVDGCIGLPGQNGVADFSQGSVRIGLLFERFLQDIEVILLA